MLSALSAYVLPPAAPLLHGGFAAPLVHSARSGSVLAQLTDNRFAGRKRPGGDDTSDAKYGHDPRDGLDTEVEADADFASTITPGSVGMLSTVNELQAALDAAAGSDSVVAIKFIRDGCVACASTRDAYASVAKAYGEKGQFYECDFDAARPFVRKCEVKFVPSAHVYANGALQFKSGMGQKTWDTFKTGLDECRDALA